MRLVECGAQSAIPHIVVLSTLHQFHAEIPGYNFDVLRRILVGLAPDAVFAEVTPTDLIERRDERIKREYPEVVYPFLNEFTRVRAHALEPWGAHRAELLERYQVAAREFQARAEYADFEKYVESWFQQLLARFRTAADLNSTSADDEVREKQAYQASLYPPGYTQAWSEWNQHFHDRIVQAVNSSKPKLAVVLVGLEHAYWLRSRLQGRIDLLLLDAEGAIEAR